MSFRRNKNVIIIIYNLYDLVCRKIFCFWVKSILGNYETALYSYFLPSDIDWYGCRWTDVHCFSIVDCRWHYSIGNITFIMDKEKKKKQFEEQKVWSINYSVCKAKGNESEMVHCLSRRYGLF